MTLSMYSASVPVFSRLLKNLRTFLEKAEAYAEQRGFKPDVLVEARLAPDMLPLRFQVQTLTDTVKGCVARLAGKEIPAWPDEEKTIADLKARLQKAIDYLETYSAADIDGSEGKTITMKIGGKEREIDGLSYLLGRALPNGYFHTTTAYAILRHNGVPLGKSDFLAQ